MTPRVKSCDVMGLCPWAEKSDPYREVWTTYNVRFLFTEVIFKERTSHKVHRQ